MSLQIADKTFPDFICHTSTEPPSASPWCTYCTKADQVSESLAVRYRGNINFGILPINAPMDTPFRLEGLSLPTIIQFRTGKEILRLSEGTSCSELDGASIELICSRT
jgi:thioredoxin-like negative regulator of GroEL